MPVIEPTETEFRPPILVRMSPQLVEELFTRDADGNRLRFSIGKPDADGVYEATVTTDYTDRIGELDEAWRAAEEALPEPGYLSLSGPFGETVYGPHDDHYNVSAWRHRDAIEGIGRKDKREPLVMYPVTNAHGPTPTAALLALADKLRSTERGEE